MIAYYKLFDLLKRRKISIEELRLNIQASSATMAKLSHHKNVSLDVIDRICSNLQCQPGDIMEFMEE